MIDTNRNGPSLSAVFPLNTIPRRRPQSVRPDSSQAFEDAERRSYWRQVMAAGHGFGLEVLDAANRLVSDRRLWSPSPRPLTGFAAFYDCD